MKLNIKKIGLWIGLIFFFVLLLIPGPDTLTPESKKTAAVAGLMVIWWITEAIPIYITAFLPVALFPVLGVLTSSETASSYGHDYVLMLLGAFILAKAIEQQGLHKRIALLTISLLGTGKKKVILGFMITTAFLSMWITNMAVVLIMLPIANALIDKEDEALRQKLGLALLLGIAYAASIGGTGTLIGTPPNLVLAGLLVQLYPDAPAFDFLEWMKIGLPLVVLFIPIVWLYLIKFFGIRGNMAGGHEIITQELTSLGKMSMGEQRVLVVFVLTALGWIFREDLIFGSFIIPGWSDFLPVSDHVHDGTVAMIGAILLFMINDGKGSKLMDWPAARNIPWGVAMFLGGGLALGTAFKNSGLAEWIGSSFFNLEGFPEFLLIFMVCGLIIFITEVNSNTATATIFLPILAAIAVAGSINPLLLMIPATFASSFAFMLPSGTGTNTVIFASERLHIADMAKTGFWLNLICMLLLPILLYFVLLPLAGIHIEAPEWTK